MSWIKKIWNKIKNLFHKKSKPVGATRVVPNAAVIHIDDKTDVLDVDLVDDDASKKDKKKVRQYTKSLVTALTIMACIWISTSYILATVALVMYGNAEPLSSLSEKVCEVIIGVVIAYAFKSYLESYSSAKHDLNVMKLESVNESINENEIDNEESVG